MRWVYILLWMGIRLLVQYDGCNGVCQFGIVRNAYARLDDTCAENCAAAVLGSHRHDTVDLVGVGETEYLLAKAVV